MSFLFDICDVDVAKGEVVRGGVGGGRGDGG